jgi:membrane-associated phospholipid phosphatase
MGYSHTSDLLIITGDILQIALPCFGFIQSLLFGDKKGVKQCLWTCLVTAAIVEIIKLSTANLSIGIRPNGGTKSFPSGHSSSSFQGAFFFHRRYGYRWGIPAILLAGLAGCSRVYGGYHHWRDIIAGLLIAWLVNMCFVTSFKEKKRQV